MKRTMKLIAGLLIIASPALASTNNLNGPTTTNNYYTDNSTTNQGGQGGAGGQGGTGIGIGVGVASASANSTIQKGAVQVDNKNANINLNKSVNRNTNLNTNKQAQAQKQSQGQGQSQQQSNSINNGNSNNSQQAVNIQQNYEAKPYRPTFAAGSAQELNTQQAQLSNEERLLSMRDQERATLALTHKGRHYTVVAEADGVRMHLSYYDALNAHKGRVDDTVELIPKAPAGTVIGIIHAAPSGSSAFIDPDFIFSAVGSMVADRFHDVYVCRTAIHYDSIELSSKGRGANVNMGGSGVNTASDLASSLIGGVAGQSGRGWSSVRSEEVFVIVAK